MTQREPESAAFYVGQGGRIGNVTVHGSIAGRDIVSGTSPADAEAAADRNQLVEVLARVEAQLAALEEASFSIPGL
jgi:hypothetical protein